MAATSNAPSAKAAIQAFCAGLQASGIDTLSAEAVRQAKFATGNVSVLWRALHDYVILRTLGDAAGPASQGALARLWVDIAREQVDEEDTLAFPQAGQDMVVQQLSAWGCPPALVARLCAEEPATSRHVLLALVWLAARDGLFESALHVLSIPPDILHLLPPFPQDTRGSLPTHSAYITAANSAEQHADKVLGVITNLGDQAHAARHRQAANGTRAGSGRLQPTLPKSAAQRPEGPPSTESVVRMWEAVDAAAHCAVSMLGKARGNLLSLQSHMDASTKLHSELAAAQSTAWPRMQPLTPFELRLLQQPASLRRHVEAMNSSAATLQRQGQLLSGAQLFYKWAASVLDQEGAACGETSKGVATQQSTTTTSTQSPAGLSALASLPAAGSDTGAALIHRLTQQVAAAAQAAEPALAAARANAAAAPQRAARPPAARLSAEHFRQLARSAIAQQPATHTDAQQGQDSNSAVSRAGTGAHANASSTAWAPMPDDVAGPAAAAAAAAQAATAREAAWFSEQLLVALGHSCVCGGMTAPKGCVSLAAGGTGLEPVAGGSVPDAASETNRVLQTTLSVARSLAQVRSGHKQAMQETTRLLEEKGLAVFA